MTKTLITTPDPDYGLTKDDALEYLGKLGAFICMDNIVIRRERIGQAWMNVLYPEDHNKLVGSAYDPFYANDWDSVANALAFLLAN